MQAVLLVSKNPHWEVKGRLTVTFVDVAFEVSENHAPYVTDKPDWAFKMEFRYNL